MPCRFSGKRGGEERSFGPSFDIRLLDLRISWWLISFDDRLSIP